MFDIFIKRPVLASVVSLLILFIGLRAFLMLPVRQYPEMKNTVITITTTFPGAEDGLDGGHVVAVAVRSGHAHLDDAAGRVGEDPFDDGVALVGFFRREDVPDAVADDLLDGAPDALGERAVDVVVAALGGEGEDRIARLVEQYPVLLGVRLDAPGFGQLAAQRMHLRDQFAAREIFGRRVVHRGHFTLLGSLPA